MTVNLKRFPELRQAEIKALLEQGYSIKKISRMADCSIETVMAVRKSNKFDRSIVEAIKDKISGKFYRVADAAVDAISHEKLQNATPVQLITTAGIAIDKARLIDGDATARVEFVSQTDNDLDSEIADLQFQLEEWKSGRLVNGEVLEGSVDATQDVPQASSDGA